ncbi:uncharacterized protein LOC124449544 isoform X1 [Xenia sp. Carnegie-2017]|uniref:uncharacterized protein LOC124449544 isoform X1 n=1 Tax=Xenia sp. Carnegie-2017 TaxID=2897299 RepID=UPI001F033A3A|nr:uncharacterized protein LOC124449544 isoform X1 [Xenia sp. Carnegie-2017]
MYSLTRSGCALFVVFFMFRGSSETVEEFSSLYLKQLGYDSFYIGLMPLFGLVTQLTGVPVCTYLADKFRLRKFTLILATLISIPAIMMYLIPQATSSPCKTKIRNYESINFHNKTQTKFLNSSFTNQRTLPHGITDNFNESTNFNEFSYYLGNSSVFKNSSQRNHGRDKLWYFLLLCILNGIFELCRRVTIGIMTSIGINHEKDMICKFSYYLGCGAAGSGIALCAVALVAGQFKYSRCGIEVPSYFVAFPTAATLQCFILLGVALLKFDYKDNAESINYKKAVLTLLKSHNIFILCIALHVGACNGFITRWQFWYMEKLGASTTVMGVEGLLKRLIISSFWFLTTGYVLNAFGLYVTMTLSLFLFAVAFILLAFIGNPWFVILIDNFELSAYTFFYTAAAFHFSKAESEALSSFIQGVLTLTMNGVGKDVGSILTGYLFRECGIKTTLCGYSVISFVWFIVLAVYTFISQEAHNYKRVKTEAESDIDEERLP